MDPVHYIFTRWSVYLNGIAEWRIVNDVQDTSTVIDALFNETRLSKKFEFFEKMTYLSIKNQTYTNYVWYIFTSSLLPQKYKDKLEVLSSPNIIIVYVTPTENLSRITSDLVKDKTLYTTLNIDDDDGLAPGFLLRLNSYMSQTGKVITFPRGTLYTIENGNLVFGGKHVYRNINLGLTAIEFNVFKAGNHYTVDERYEVIVDDTPDMYWVCCSEVCDTKRKFSMVETVKKR